MSGYTRIPHQVIEEIVPALSEAELRIYLYLMRATWGWNCDETALSLSVIQHATRLSNRTHMIRAIRKLEDRGLIRTKQQFTSDGKQTTTLYRVVPAGYPVPAGYGVPAEPEAPVPGRHPLKKEVKKADEDLWTTVLERLQRQMTEANYRTWLADTRPQGRRGTTLVVGAPSAFVQEWLQTRFRLLVRRALQDLDVQLTDVVFEVVSREQMA